jgi:hypothetical protein
MIPVVTSQENEQQLRHASLDASLRAFEALLSSSKMTPKADISEVEIVRVAALFYAYLKGEAPKP